MGIGVDRVSLTIVTILAFAFVRAPAALAPPASIAAECEQATAALDDTSPKLSMGDLTDFIDESFKDPSLIYCQPFMGCEARAHVIAKRLTERGAKVRKIFAEGRLLAFARDNKYYAWQGHVAAMVEVTDTVDGRPRTREMVIDPALFDHPVPEEEWKSAMLSGTTSSANFSYGEAGKYEPPSNPFTNSKPGYYDQVAQNTLRAVSKLNSLPSEAQTDFQKQMRIDRELNAVWDAEGFLQRWQDPVFRRAWMNKEIKPRSGRSFNNDYWRNWQPPR